LVVFLNAAAVMGRADGHRPSDQYSRLVQGPDKTDRKIFKSSTFPCKNNSYSIECLNFITTVTDTVQHW